MSQSTDLSTEDLATAGASAVADPTGLCGQSLCNGRFHVEQLLGRGAQGAVFRIGRRGPGMATDKCRTYAVIPGTEYATAAVSRAAVRCLAGVGRWRLQYRAA
jgi:hypothetical protein